jgi:hypothetical protein
VVNCVDHCTGKLSSYLAKLHKWGAADELSDVISDLWVLQIDHADTSEARWGATCRESKVSFRSK